jgi:hypothetical protein
VGIDYVPVAIEASVKRRCVAGLSYVVGDVGHDGYHREHVKHDDCSASHHFILICTMLDRLSADRPLYGPSPPGACRIPMPRPVVL